VKTNNYFQSFRLCIIALLVSANISVYANWDYHDIKNVDFWIGAPGPAGPIFSGPHQYPFICYTLESGLGQPLIDNQDGVGNAVFPEYNGIPIFTADPIGYSKNCAIATRVDYFYFSNNANNFLPLADPAAVPADAEKILLRGKEENFVVRLERGTINRFIYSIAMLAPYAESLDKPSKLNLKAWNKKLLYKFHGGVGIGHWQGEYKLSKDHALFYDALKKGFAVAFSTGTVTSTHYNMQLSEETALMLKAHFIATYGKPKYTIGLGGSGGAIQQYIIGQNNQSILDGAIAQLSYPDMITQTIHIADCELLERYFDTEYTLNPLSRWGDWTQRTLIEGLAANNTADIPPWNANPYAPSPGLDECINGWRGIVQNLINPFRTDPAYIQALQIYRYPADVIANTKWSHWNDLGNIYPQDENGVAYSTWDNIGVQYGLRELKSGAIDASEFLQINACVGGWRQPQEMTIGEYPWNPDGTQLDPWDQANMNVNPFTCRFGDVAPRTQGNLQAMHAAYTSGQVFQGEIEIPILDIRWNLEPVLNMHHLQGSFSVRARMAKHNDHFNNQIIWIADCSDLDPVKLTDNCAYDPTPTALDVMDQWLTNLRADDDNQKMPPSEAVDTCFDDSGTVIYAGADAWNGVIDNKPKGPCSDHFAIYSTSRQQAGGDFRADIFKCALKSLSQAIDDGDYGDVVFTPLQLLVLNNIFPQGVCDYKQDDFGKP